MSVKSFHAAVDTVHALLAELKATPLILPQDAHDMMKVYAASTHGRCVLGLAGSVEIMAEAMNQYLSSELKQAEEVEGLEKLLWLFASVVEDEDNATLSARMGSHPLLLRLMEDENEAIQEAVAEAIGICSTSGSIPFPHRIRQIGDIERPRPLFVPLPKVPSDDSEVGVLIRQVPTRMTGQPKTGYLLWGAAIVLARWIHLRRELFAQKSVLEVGSGLGLSGIVAARYAGAVTLTDYQDDTIRALKYNIELNTPFIKNLEPTRSDVHVQHLDWDSLESIQQGDKVDIIIASDIICEPSTAEGFLRVVRHRLKANGVAYLMNANGHSRFGVYHLHELLSTSGLNYSITPVDEMELGPAILDTVSDAQELRYDYYEIRLPPPLMSTL